MVLCGFLLHSLYYSLLLYPWFVIFHVIFSSIFSLSFVMVVVEVFCPLHTFISKLVYFIQKKIFQEDMIAGKGKFLKRKPCVFFLSNLSSHFCTVVFFHFNIILNFPLKTWKTLAMTMTLLSLNIAFQCVCVGESIWCVVICDISYNAS